jgi:hypothetical protein
VFNDVDVQQNYHPSKKGEKKTRRFGLIQDMTTFSLA